MELKPLVCSCRGPEMLPLIQRPLRYQACEDVVSLLIPASPQGGPAGQPARARRCCCRTELVQASDWELICLCCCLLGRS